uniref:PMS1 homolog 1, mismatch repair system component n=1 Tax=Oncorhynchus tshawytscha TaxID=74940 RepID=A0A8C8IAA2_ONCTS
MNRLPADTVRLLSSCQVINSVVNVVKELLENSLDAGALSIDIKLENYGFDRIEIRDNGSGIKAADTAVMAVQHYTSKICSHDDLEHLVTYGFRGEALGSICAVAEVAVTTKTSEDDVGTRYTLDLTGSVVSQKPSHLGQGTTVCVLKLFKNLPVRRQYYVNTKKCKEELKKVQDLLMAYAIIKPELRLTLTHNKVVLWQKAKVSDHRMALMATLGPNAVAHLLPVHHQQPEIVIDGFFPRPGMDCSLASSSNPDKTFIFVNDRPVHQKDILKVKTFFYPADSALNRYPTVMLNITVPSSTVDVNLTPDKTQILLQNKVPFSIILSISLQTVLTVNSKLTIRDFDLAFPQLEDYMASTGTGTTNPGTAKGLERLDNHDQGHDKGKDVEQLSAVSWSRGTALTDPSTGEPLQPVKIHLATGWSSDLGQVKAKGQSSPGKKVSNAITEKRAALTAYDLINNRAMRTPLSPAALFERETRASVLQEKPTASLQDITTAVQERWKNLGEEDRKKYEDKAKKHLERYDLQTKLASDRDVREPERRLCLVSPLSRPQGQKRKVLPSNQPVLDQLFFSQPQKKRSPGPKPSQPLPFSVVTLRQRLHRLSFQSNPRPQGLRLVNRLASQSAWVVLCGRKLVLLNPFRVEEALLFKRLLENNILPAASLQNPIQLTDSILGGAEYTQSLCTMEKGSPELRGMAIFSDPRLVANGFQITLTPGSSSTERHLEVTAMADCVPFLGMEDLREILTAVLHRNAKTVKECRPLKVTNYLQGEAVRLARQLPVTLAKEDVEDILLRMQQQLEETSQACIHGQAFFHHLSDIPDTEQEALKIMSNIL